MLLDMSVHFRTKITKHAQRQGGENSIDDTEQASKLGSDDADPGVIRSCI